MIDLFVGDFGHTMEVNTGITLTSYTNCSLKVKKPDGSLHTWTSSSSDTKLSYVIQTGDLDLEGTYSLHSYVTKTAGAWHGSGVSFNVRAVW